MDKKIKVVIGDEDKEYMDELAEGIEKTSRSAISREVGNLFTQIENVQKTLKDLKKLAEEEKTDIDYIKIMKEAIEQSEKDWL